MNLRDALLASLAGLPGKRDFHVHVLQSSPRKRSGLFPYAHPRPRVYVQDILVLLSEQSTLDAPRVLVTAIEASVYNVPTTSCGILYISKVDSTGQGSAPSPTPALVQSLLAFYGDPATRPIAVDTLWIHLFARAQGQYLFPNSAEYPGKRPLSDVRLCAWWKRIFSGVRETLEARRDTLGKIHLYYVLPGYNELEALHTLNAAPTAHAHDTQWIYGHPYSQSDIPLPCPHGDDPPNLGHYIPSFDDDPKSRFIDEIAHTTDTDGIKSPQQKRRKTSLNRAVTDRGPFDGQDQEHGEDSREARHQGELARVTPDEFWERMSFRQECVAGAVTGFFTMGITSLSSPSENPPGRPLSRASEASTPLAPQPAQVAPRLVRRVVASLMTAHEFSTTERAVRATETLEAAIKGLCDNLSPAPLSPKPRVSHIAHLLFPRATTPPPADSTMQVPTTPPRRSSEHPYVPDNSPNPFPEPVASLETYNSYIYGTVSIDNPCLPNPKIAAEATHGDTHGSAGGKARPATQVTVLAARKKRKA